MSRRDAATEAQVRAADPGLSVWLAANAGSGKTRVLTDRVARLLLGGTSPQHILCLTYTKAAATEMQNRLFRRLGTWAMLDDTALRKDLAVLGVDGQIESSTVAHARRLFAQAIETPGGLKIQTIHSFCASLLRRFPLEAGVSPQFVEMDERSARILRMEIADEIAGGPDQRLFDDAAAAFTGDSFENLTAEIVKHKTHFTRTSSAADISALFGIPADLTEAEILAGVFKCDTPELFAALLPKLRAGSITDQKNATALSEVNLRAPGMSDLIRLEGALLFGAKANAGAFSAKIGSFPTKATQGALGDWLSALHKLMLRVELARKDRIRLCSAQKTLALHGFAQAFLPEYARRKERRGWLDFDDLILKARALLVDPLVAQWVLYRLDGGIDHILVDEAQDTSPAQWDVIKRLAQEFTAGEGARADTTRSLFVVGDKKQSIYSFQGADPDGFDRMREYFEEKLRQADHPFQAMDLEYSFRSANPVLRLVDLTFQERHGNGLGGSTLHKAFKADMPGRIDLWPVVEGADEPEERPWYDPVDQVSQNHHAVVLAGKVADEVARMIREEVIPDDSDTPGTFVMRAVQPGDFLILVQRRSDIFHEIIRACKARGLQIAGADRLRIGAEMAVKDLTALLSFIATPEDDLSLAAALRSPLFGWSEQALHRLAQGRSGFLWTALRGQSETQSDTINILQDLRDNADFLRPYDLLERILTRHGGRKNLTARLGMEAEDGINALLSQALAHETNDIPGLTGFLCWLAADEVEIKRQMDSASNRIRVMTVHGAKGLESPIVILPDTAQRKLDIRSELLQSGDTMLWKTAREEQPEPMATAYDALREAQVRERDRLLYVAMTRAEKWLIVAASGDVGKDGSSWYEMVRTGMEAAGASSFGGNVRLEEGDWSGVASGVGRQPDADSPPLPDWSGRQAEPHEVAESILSPSLLGGAKALPGDAGLNEAAALARGSALHLLLEHLPHHPPEIWQRLTGTLLVGFDLINSGAQELLTEARNVLTAPELEHLFGPKSLAEVDITARLPSLAGQRIYGAIDRLIIDADRVLAVDFKSNAMVPASADLVPDGLLRQMGAYGAALAQIYPNHRIETAILWTRTATLMPLPQESVMRALSSAASP